MVLVALAPGPPRRTRFDVQGVVSHAIENGRIASGRLYMGDLPNNSDGKEET